MKGDLIMRFGMPTLLETKSLEECAKLCSDLGLEFIEINMNFPEYQNKFDLKHLSEISEKFGLYYTIHLDEKLSPCDFNERVADAYTETVLMAIETAIKLDVPIINMHLADGVYITLPDKRAFLFDEYIDVYIGKLTKFRDRCEKAIGNTDVKICVENTGGYNRAGFLGKSIEVLLESPAFALTYDIGHDAAAGFVDGTVIKGFSGRLCHMHVHDANGKNVHLALGDGRLDLLKYLDIAKKNNCRMVLETKTVEALTSSVQWLKKKEML